MDVHEVLRWADSLVFTKTGKHLDHVQTAILEGTWQHQKYAEIAAKCSYSEAHIRSVAADLWKVLSDLLAEDLNKYNFRASLERWIASPISNYGNCVQIGHGNGNINL